MAIDGWVCATKMPSRTETDNQMAYRNRKGLWGFTVLAGCDARTRFLMWCCNAKGSANDIMAWRQSAMFSEVFSKNLLPKKYFFIGDEAFINEDQFLTPYGGRGIGIPKDSFNYHLSVRRQTIERAFGILTKRWGVFQRPLICGLERWSLIATVGAKLHNICIEMNVPVVPRHFADMLDGDDWIVNLNELPHNNDFRDGLKNVGGRRMTITQSMAEQKIMRPSHASANSKANH